RVLVSTFNAFRVVNACPPSRRLSGPAMLYKAPGCVLRRLKAYVEKQAHEAAQGSRGEPGEGSR
ncbi:MAG: hypothetical protein ACE5EU_10770, partial [Paracoccaceae bacterium]